jgi:hypothetical protein
MAVIRSPFVTDEAGGVLGLHQLFAPAAAQPENEDRFAPWQFDPQSYSSGIGAGNRLDPSQYDTRIYASPGRTSHSEGARGLASAPPVMSTSTRFLPDTMEQLSQAYGSNQPRPLRQARAESALPRWIDNAVERFIGVESRGIVDAKNPSSTATGLGQFIDGTWLETVKRYRPEQMLNRSDLRKDPGHAWLSRDMTRQYLIENMAKLQQKEVPITPGNLYLAHFSGAGGASATHAAYRDDPATPVTAVLEGKALIANRDITNKAGKKFGDWTVGELVEWADAKMRGVDAEPRRAPRAYPLLHSNMLNTGPQDTAGDGAIVPPPSWQGR